MASSSISIPELKIGTIKMTLVGDGILVTNRFHQQVIEEIQAKFEGKAASKKAPMEPISMARNALHVIETDGKLRIDEPPVLEDMGAQVKLPHVTVHGDKWEEAWFEGEFGFPAIGVKSSAVTAAKDCGLEMTVARRAFHINTDLCRIDAQGPRVRRDAVKPNFNTTTLAFRPEFRDWKIPIEIEYNRDILTADQIVNLFYRAGFGVGIGSFRPERDGSWGRFHVAPEIEVIA